MNFFFGNSFVEFRTDLVTQFRKNLPKALSTDALRLVRPQKSCKPGSRKALTGMKSKIREQGPALFRLNRYVGKATIGAPDFELVK